MGSQYSSGYGDSVQLVVEDVEVAISSSSFKASQSANGETTDTDKSGSEKRRHPSTKGRNSSTVVPGEAVVEEANKAREAKKAAPGEGKDAENRFRSKSAGTAGLKRLRGSVSTVSAVLNLGTAPGKEQEQGQAEPRNDEETEGDDDDEEEEAEEEEEEDSPSQRPRMLSFGLTLHQRKTEVERERTMRIVYLAQYRKLIPAALTEDPVVNLRKMKLIRQNWKTIMKGTAPGYLEYVAEFTAEQKQKPSQHRLRPISSVTQFYDTCYKELFALQPDAKALFKGSMVRQGKMLVAVVSKLCTLDLESEAHHQILPGLELLADRHVDFGVFPEHYGAMAHALLHAVGLCSGDDWTDELKDAWQQVFSFVSIVLIVRSARRMEINNSRKRSSVGHALKHFQRMLELKLSATGLGGGSSGDAWWQPKTTRDDAYSLAPSRMNSTASMVETRTEGEGCPFAGGDEGQDEAEDAAASSRILSATIEENGEEEEATEGEARCPVSKDPEGSERKGSCPHAQNRPSACRSHKKPIQIQEETKPIQEEETTAELRSTRGGASEALGSSSRGDSSAEAESVGDSGTQGPSISGERRESAVDGLFKEAAQAQAQAQQDGKARRRSFLEA